MIIGLRKKLIAAFSILVFISISNFGLLWVAEQNAAKQQIWIIHTQEVIHDSEALLGHLRDAETGQRGFLLTNQPEYLEPYHAGISKAQQTFTHLKELTSDNPQQQARLDSLQIDMNNKLRELNETIELAQQNMPQKAMALVTSGVGKRHMGALRTKLQAFKDEENRLLQKRQGHYESGKQTMRILFAGEALLLISFIMVLALVLQRRLVSPLVNLTKNTVRMMNGKNVDFPSITSNDEIGELTTSFQKMSSTVTTTMKDLELAKIEAELKEQRLSEIIWSANVGTWQWDINTDELALNSRWADMLGYELNELTPSNFTTWKDRTHPDELKHMLEQFNKLSSDKLDYYEGETLRHHKNGSWVWILDRGRVSERDAKGKPIRVSGTSTDISNRKQADIAKSEFISTVSHELRTPLTSIKGSLDLIKAGVTGELNEKTQSLLDIAANNSERLVLLINDILDIEKMEAGKMDYFMNPVDVATMITEAVEANKSYGEQHGVTFMHSEIPENIFIEGDRNRLAQVLSNLMSNAAKFSPSGAEVHLSVSVDSDFVRIAVKDQGTGIPEEFRDSLFDKFTQADSSDTRKIGGTGLGLSITKTIVEEHNGSIGYESEINKGSTFFFSLPRLPS